MFRYDYSDKSKYEILDRDEYEDTDSKYKIVEEKYKDIENNCEIIRKLRFKKIYTDKNIKLTQKQLDCINERLKWEKFGSELTTPAEVTQCDDEFMVYNTEILKSKKSKKYIRENNISPYVEPILFDVNTTLDELMIKDTDLYHLLKTNQTRYLAENKKKRLECIERIKKKEEEQNKKYIPPSQRKPKNSNEIKSLKITNLGDINDYGEKYLYSFFKSFNISRFKLYIPKNKETNQLKNICFLNFNNNSDAGKSLDILKGIRLENSILCVEFANY